MGTVSLNLSRKWRSQNFDQIVGQDLVVRILKNSLYMGQYFPVYLFAGQRGCGKTSTARIFAAAINCASFTSFQKDPKSFSVPCLICLSCNAMKDGNHPDFIEIDAASHTGVDNMRSIIESSSLLPILGRKRVYLIDEAHMLSKAAFNAALKILEEPPATALFILATTNPHKIIDTVRSRCFQLFFTPISHDPLKGHLQSICKKEGIAYDDEGLDIIIRHTQGSARDALNVLEQVRFSSSLVNKAAVLKLLGHMSDQHILDIIDVTLRGTASQLLHILHRLDIDNYCAEFIWQRLMTLLRSLLWVKYGVQPDKIISSVAMVEKVALLYSCSDIHKMVEVLYSHEELFLKTTMQHVLLEMILLSLCQKDKKKTDEGSGAVPHPPFVGNLIVRSVDSSSEEKDDEDCQDKGPQPLVIAEKLEWTNFVEGMALLDDPLISSLFKQARFINYDQRDKKITIEFAKDLILFKDWLDSSRAVWQPVVNKAFGCDILLEPQFTGINKVDKQSKQIGGHAHQQEQQRPCAVIKPQTVQYNKEKTPQSPGQEQFFGGQNYKKKVMISPQKNEVRLDVSDEGQWQVASMLLRHFPGVITEIRENQ